MRRLALALPGVEERPCYGTPGFRVGGKLFARLHQDGESLVLKVDYLERELLMQADPQAFYVTDHYRNHPWLLVRLARVRAEPLGELIERAWRRAAPKRLLRPGAGR